MPETDSKGKFIKGNSGGPGKPKGSVSLITILKQKLDAIDPATKKTGGQVLMEKVLMDAYKKDGQSRRLVMQYAEGMPQQKVETTHILPSPLIKLDEVHSNNSYQENSGDAEENKSITRGNSSVKDNLNIDLLDSPSPDKD